ncbi:hypothetical protein NHL51_03330 [Leucobacter sp. gxy201]|uniref:hypothetical protein n=1 Tax=Leucobacter sp. gxy201 TaxID=2957200 RepID=UPI003D9FC07E
MTYETGRILIRAVVEPLASGSDRTLYTCQGSPAVPATVELADPLGDRELVDETCLAPENQDTAFCIEDGGVRWG